MLTDKLRSFFQKDNTTGSPSAYPRPSTPGSLSPRRSSKGPLPPVSRQSRGLEQFFFNIRDTVGLSILDLTSATQENINFLTNLGHRIYTQDVLRSLDEAFGTDPNDQNNPGRIEFFLKTNFDFPPESFDGVLLWDTFQFMSPALLSATVDRLYEVMRPNAYLLAFFTANDRVSEVPSHSFRILDNKTILVHDRGLRSTGQVFNNRNLEKLFGKFESVKFFLTRESLREIIVRR